MSELLQATGDDELALIGCAAALVVSAAVMYFSFYIGQFVRRSEDDPICLRIETPAQTPATAESGARKAA